MSITFRLIEEKPHVRIALPPRPPRALGIPADVPAGPVAFEFNNAGHSAHEMVIIALGEGADLDELLASEEEPSEDELFRPLLYGQTILMVTHDDDVAVAADRVVRMRDGRVENPEPAVAATPSSVEL